MAEEMRKDAQSVTADGKVLLDLPHGVELREMSNIITRNGVTTEVVRSEWDIGRAAIDQIIYVTLRPRAISAWHCHHIQTDRIFVTEGTVRLVVFDGRDDSPTKGKLSVLHLSRMRPTLVLIPPFVWHGLQNLENENSSFINFFDRAYCHENPDEWRLPSDSAEIPYRFVQS